MHRRPFCTPFLVLLFCASLSVRPVVADDLNPPPYRGDLFTTAAEWDFLSAQPEDNIQPDGTSVPLVKGDAAPLLDAAFPVGAPHPSGALFGDVEWSSASNGGYRGGPLGDGGIVFNVPNWVRADPEKRLRIQITYQGPPPTVVMFGFDGVPGTSDSITEVFRQRVYDTHNSLPAGSGYFYEDWHMYPSPVWEQVAVFLSPSTFVDQVVIDSVVDAVSLREWIFADGLEAGNTERWTTSVP